MNKFNILAIVLGILALLISVMLAQRIDIQPWMPVKTGITFGISGIALVQQEKDNSLLFLVVHDNKRKEEQRFALIFLQGRSNLSYIPLKFPPSSDVPADLEAVTVVPNAKQPSFMALASSGQVYHIKVDIHSNQVSLLKVFELPGIGKDSNFEGFALQEIDGKLIAVWASRGSDKQPGIIYWGLLDLKTYQISQQGSREIIVPFPLEKVRHISDIKVDPAGSVYITAAMDSGKNGPFKSAVYVAGVFCLDNSNFSFRINPGLVPLYILNDHKVEGIELVSGAVGGVFLGTDDENQGAAIWRQF